MGKSKRVRRSAATWRRLFSRQASSGLTVPGFCRREGINAGVFRRWRSALKDSTGTTTMSKAVSRAAAPFIDIGDLGASRRRFEVRLDLGDGILLSLVRNWCSSQRRRFESECSASRRTCVSPTMVCRRLPAMPWGTIHSMVHCMYSSTAAVRS